LLPHSPTCWQAKIDFSKYSARFEARLSLLLVSRKCCAQGVKKSGHATPLPIFSKYIAGISLLRTGKPGLGEAFRYGESTYEPQR
jgi:hypothetical protein